MHEDPDFVPTSVAEREAIIDERIRRNSRPLQSPTPLQVAEEQLRRNGRRIALTTAIQTIQLNFKGARVMLLYGPLDVSGTAYKRDRFEHTWQWTDPKTGNERLIVVECEVLGASKRTREVSHRGQTRTAEQGSRLYFETVAAEMAARAGKEGEVGKRLLAQLKLDPDAIIYTTITVELEDLSLIHI